MEDRRLAVLRAIVEDYVDTREPVGSRALAERHRLGVSPATIRNDMAALEEAGLIAQPHTSAGRIPTDKGYRYFVDQISTVKPLNPAERRAIQKLLDGAHDLDDIVERTVRLLAQLTQQVAIVQYPSLKRSSVRHIELISVGEHRILLVVITDAGRVQQRTIETDTDLDEATLGEVRVRINAATSGLRTSAVSDAMAEVVQTFPPHLHATINEISTALTQALVDEVEDRVVLAGTANLARADIDFTRSISPVLDAIEEHVVLLRLLHEMAEDAHDVAVRIGAENIHAGLVETSLVSAGYGVGDDVRARMGVLGPTRMNYPTSIATVRAVARYVSRILAS
ncbi:MAG TPA: heat-inducible transcriptional repressor HrcA [Actinomycetales bacterium]|nr:heat-inducible transcriptional repressor HrcA [Actinomycetales bacterium]